MKRKSDLKSLKTSEFTGGRGGEGGGRQNFLLKSYLISNDPFPKNNLVTSTSLNAKFGMPK